jgi:hypothetical protein
MYQKILKKPRKWDERSLALATKEELVADLLIRKARLKRTEGICFGRKVFIRKREIYWIEILKQELNQRSQWVIEGE